MWIKAVKIRSLCRRCIKCLRFASRTQEQLMALLPKARVRPARPIRITRVHYSCPFAIHTSKGRGQHSSKRYVPIFTCFATKAVHIEVVSDYSYKTFLLAFRRFVARRGLCHTIVSDNDTTFQGADTDLRRAFQETTGCRQEISDEIRADSVTWTFIPPQVPDFGDLW